MPSSSSPSIGRYSSYSLYSSYPTYRTPTTSSYINRTTSLDRSAYGPSGCGSSYYRYAGASKGISTIPPRNCYSSSYTDTSSRYSRSVRTSPNRSSLGSTRLYSDSSSSSYSSDRGESRYSTRPRDYSSSRDSAYESRYTSRDPSVEYHNGNYDVSRRNSSSARRRDSEYERDEEEKVKVSERIRAIETWRKDPAEERLALRRKRLGLSPSRESSGSRSPNPPYSAKVKEDNRRITSEENGNDAETVVGSERRTSVPDLCRKYNSNLNITNGNESLKVSSGCSGGAGPLLAQPKDYNTVSSSSSSSSRPVSPVDVKSTRTRYNSYKDDKESATPIIVSPETTSANRSPRPKSPIEKDSSYKSSAARSEVDTIRSSYTLPFRSRDRKEKLRERIALRLSNELQDGDSPISRRRSPTGGSSESFSEINGLVGLRNIGNTCFMNSITQCLSNTRCLLEYILQDNYASDINMTLSSMRGDLIKAFGALLREMWGEGASGPVNTGAFKGQIQRFAPAFIGFAQHDAQEFLRKLLEGLHEDVNRVTVKPRPITEDIDETLDDHQKAMESWKRYLRYDDSRIVDMFVGQLKSSLQCSVCNHTSVTFDPFWDLSLPIPSRSGQVKLTQCIDLFTKEEVLDGDERPTCSKCKERRKMTKTFSIQKFPKVLVLHLKRFSPHERWRGKLTCMVDFPLDSLDLSRYAACASISSHYRLTSVANHSGTALSGHYTAYCRHPYLKTWHEYNDSRVSSISSNRVCSAEAYVLFYELINSY